MTNEERREAERLAASRFGDEDVLYESDRRAFVAGYAAACEAKRSDGWLRVVKKLEAERARFAKFRSLTKRKVDWLIDHLAMSAQDKHLQRVRWTREFAEYESQSK